MAEEAQDINYYFAPVSGEDQSAGVIQCADEPRLACLAGCIADQQRAGFGGYLDIRQTECPDCKAPGFNTGWGVFRFACGAEVHTDDEGTPAEPCPATSVERTSEEGDG